MNKLPVMPALPGINTLLVAALSQTLTHRSSLGISTPCLPETGAMVRRVSLHPQTVARFNRLLNFDQREETSSVTGTGSVANNAIAICHPCYLQVLAFRLQLYLMLTREFPFKASGLIHLANNIRQLKSVPANAVVSLSCQYGELQAHPKGWVFEMITQVRLKDTLVWESVSRYLKKASEPLLKEQCSHLQAEMGEPILPEQAKMLSRWQLDRQVGWRYARVSGDFNPIHLTSWSARMFGMPNMIAHGMYLKARILSEVSHRLPEAFAAQVQFFKPVRLPAEVSLWTDSNRQALQAEVVSADTALLHLRAQIQL